MRKTFIPLLALGLAAAAGAAHAGNVSWSVGINLGPPPVYVAPAPVYYAPPPPPRVVYVRPSPVVYYEPYVYGGPVVVQYKAKRHKHRHHH